MTSTMRRFLVTGCLSIGLALMPAPAQAQLVNPYTPGGVNPLLPNPYTPGSYPPGLYPPYYPGYGGYGYGYGLGEVLFGQADIMRAYGMVINNQEQARLLREQAIQAKMDTQRKRFELDMYIRANTPTFTEEQAKVAQTTLRRIKTNSTPLEVTTGKSLNLVLDDVRKFPNRKVSSDIQALSEGVLLQLNVTSTDVGLGALRGGKITWPVGLQEALPPEQRKTLDTQAQALVQDAAKGSLDPNVLKDFSNELDRAYESVLKRVNDLGPNYLEAKRFLTELKDARRALEKGEAKHQLEYMKWVGGGGKTVQDVVDYMITKGLRFAPATLQDDAAYRAFFSAFVAYDVTLNAQASTSEAKEP